MSSPRLPPELERAIFESALENNILDATNLFLIAKCVQSWLTPKAFSVVFLIPRRCFPIEFTIQKFKKYGHHIKHLCVGVTVLWNDDGSYDDELTVVERCLSFCPNIVSFAVRSEPAEVAIRPDVITRCPSLCYLSLNPLRFLGLIGSDYDQTEPPANGLQPQFPPFLDITHLEVNLSSFSELSSTSVQNYIAIHFPSLTHIAFYHYPNIKPETILAFLDQNLFPHVEVLILWKITSVKEIRLSKPGGTRELPEGVSAEEKKRIVVIDHPRKDWEVGTSRRGLYMWDFADQVMKERRVGE